MNSAGDFTQYLPHASWNSKKKSIMFLELEETLTPNAQVTGTDFPTIYLHCIAILK